MNDINKYGSPCWAKETIWPSCRGVHHSSSNQRIEYKTQEGKEDKGSSDKARCHPTTANHWTGTHSRHLVRHSVNNRVFSKVFGFRCLLTPPRPINIVFFCDTITHCCLCPIQIWLRNYHCSSVSYKSGRQCIMSRRTFHILLTVNKHI